METERVSPRYSDIDLWEPGDILDALIESQMAAVAAVRPALSAIEQAAAAMRARLSGSGRLIYAGAGTSGRLAVQDGAATEVGFKLDEDVPDVSGFTPSDFMHLAHRGVECCHRRFDAAFVVVPLLVASASTSANLFSCRCMSDARSYHS